MRYFFLVLIILVIATHTSCEGTSFSGEVGSKPKDLPPGDPDEKNPERPDDDGVAPYVLVKGGKVTTFKNTSITIRLQAESDSLDPAVFSATTKTQEGTLEVKDDQNGIFIYTPNRGFAGTDQFDYTARKNGISAQPQTVQIQIINREPKLTDPGSQNFTIPRLVGSTLPLTATVRDFRDGHPDFEVPGGNVTRGMLADDLDADGKPVYIRRGGYGYVRLRETFNQWYRDVAGVNLSTTITLPLTYDAVAEEYVFVDRSFFPINNQLYGNEGRVHNYHFTLELVSTFTYTGNETFTFRGDDDLWVFLNRKLAIDLGGIHSEAVQTIRLEDNEERLGIAKGGTYDFHLFFAERKYDQSRFTVETNIILDIGTFELQLSGTDEDEDVLSYRLIQAPTGMSIDSAKGRIVWSPSHQDLGEHLIEVAVTDGDAEVTGFFTVTVAEEE